MGISKKESAFLIFVLLAFYILLITRNAWISDDAIIPFRVVENFLAGWKPGYKKGPNVYVIDNYALADPLLAHLPAVEWEIGHFRREIPEGYVETLQSGENHIADPNLALYYSKLQVLMTGPIWNKNRMVEIWNFNTGQYDYLLERYSAESAN